MAAFVTTISASSGALTWVLIDLARLKKFSGVSFCCGALAGLVGVTPSSGYVAPWASILIGIISSACCCYAFKIKEIIDVDDSLDAFGLHGVGGFVGSLLTGIFAQKWIGELDGTNLLGGVIDGNHMQLVYQLLGSLAIASYSFFGTAVILFCIQRLPGLSLRLTPQEEAAGGDHVEMGEAAYEYLYVDYIPTFPSFVEPGRKRVSGVNFEKEMANKETDHMMVTAHNSLKSESRSVIISL
jgi:Amt family ammonium transporter